MTPLENRLVLHRFMCHEFGYCDLPTMLEKLRDIPAGFDVAEESEYAHALYLRLNPDKAKISRDQFIAYGSAIASLSSQLRMTSRHSREWKPHQWLALLFAEHYLRCYFDDTEKLRDELNKAKMQNPLTKKMPDYTVENLRTVAVQSATGSGKTLVMHAHILQYRRLAEKAGKPPNNVILVTPNEQLSEQHERELLESNLPARLFSGDAGADLLATIKIIDINKLAEKKGVKRVAVSDFDNNNLVLVDEGHLGASGKVWRKRIAELASGGFTFEYSATFNQIIDKDSDLRDTYGKSLLFDYPYRAFHADGYGKDYSISNLPQGAEDENSDMYLLGCLLSFYRQSWIWRERHTKWADFNVTRPLWVFLGKTVTGNTNPDKATKSDVVRILDFFGWVLAHGDDVRPMIANLLAGKSGLTDTGGSDFFVGRFVGLENKAVDALYDDICTTLFHGPGQLHVVYLTQGEGELHLRTADNAPFGVVNIGDSAALYRLLEKENHPNIVVERETGFAQRLFADVDRVNSTVNIVVGARRFIAGWNSWRVSTMGLMHVGVGEGPEIIQMFGRGIRLKGRNMSLKRHDQEIESEPPADASQLMELETLHIFGLRANYMQTFRDLLAKDGMRTEQKTVRLPVTWNFARKNLKIIRIKDGLRYEYSDERPVLPAPDDQDFLPVEIDMYSRLQAVESRDVLDAATGKHSFKLKHSHTAMFDRVRIYDKLLAHKRRMGWHNLAIRSKTVNELLDCSDWYDLRLPPERQQIKNYADIRKLEDIAVKLIAEYAAQYWQQQRRRWEAGKIEVKTLDGSDPNNIRRYKLSVDAKKTELVKNIHNFSEYLREGPAPHLRLGVIMADAHAYKPLLYATGKGEVTVQPVPLNENEKQIVEELAKLARVTAPCLDGRELFLIRNLSRGRGVSFFDDHKYFPDFIVWLMSSENQHIIFLDPKGLVYYGQKERKKVALHTEIKNVEERVRKKDPTLRLHAYILSVTSPDDIGDEPHTREEWEEKGVYFPKEDSDWHKRMFKKVLGSVPT